MCVRVVSFFFFFFILWSCVVFVALWLVVFECGVSCRGVCVGCGVCVSLVVLCGFVF